MRLRFCCLRALVIFCCLSSVCLVLAALAAAAQIDNSHTSIAVEALSRLKGMDLESNPSLKAAVLKVLEQVRGTPQFLQIVRDFQIKGQGREVTELASQHPEDSSAVETMRMVLNEHNSEFLKPLLASSNAANLIKLLGNTGDREIVKPLLPLVQDDSRDILLRKLAVQSLSQTQDGAAALLDLAEKKILPADVKLTATMALNNVQWPGIKRRVAELLPLPQSKNATALPISELASLKGDPAKGAEVFRSEVAGCNKCHQVNGEGIDFGPNLSDIGGKLGKDALYESILDPSAGISFGYESWQIELKNGEEVYGLIISETADDLALKTAGGITTRYRKVQIEKRQKQKLSAMPAGLQAAMTKEQLVDLIEYLASLKTVKH